MHSIADPHALYAHAGVGTFNIDRPVVENNKRDSQDRRLLHRPTFPSLDRMSPRFVPASTAVRLAAVEFIVTHGFSRSKPGHT